jgi:hypothetical protein
LKFAFGAQFVEVRVNRRTCEIRVPRALGRMPPAESSIPRQRAVSCCRTWVDGRRRTSIAPENDAFQLM